MELKKTVGFKGRFQLAMSSQGRVSLEAQKTVLKQYGSGSDFMTL